MKKWQASNKIKPGNPKNSQIARWGRLAGSPATEMYRRFFTARGMECKKPMMPAEFYHQQTFELGELVYLAMAKRDAETFRKLADIIEAMPSKDRQGDLLPTASHAYGQVLMLMDFEKEGRWKLNGKDVSKWTRVEMLDHLREMTGEKIEVSTLNRIMKATGLKLRKDKPGPKKGSGLRDLVR